MSENCLTSRHDPRRKINLRMNLPRNKRFRFPKNLAHTAILGVVTKITFLCVHKIIARDSNFLLYVILVLFFKTRTRVHHESN